MRESNVFHRRLDRELPRAVKAEGVYIYDEDGKRYLDASGGPICVNVGHGRSEIAEAVFRQMKEVAYVHGTMFTSAPVEELASALARHAPEGIDRFYFCSGGSEAVEAAVKLARQIHVAMGRPERYRLISRWQSYHGATMGALSYTGKPGMRAHFLPMLGDVVHIPPPYCLRCFYGLNYPACGLRCAHALEDAILLEGGHTISAFLAETVSGATLGAVVPPAGYYDVIAEICKEYGILLILDEVMSGMGRTGRWFGLEHFKVKPDLLIMGKGLGGGYFPISAVGCRGEHIEAIRERCGNFSHGHTYSHHAVAAAAGLEVVRIMEREDLVSEADRKGRILGELLESLKDHPNVGDTRGIGLMRAVEIVADKKTLKPFPRSAKTAERLYLHLLDSGILTYTCAGFAGGDGDALMLGPPYIIKDGELKDIVDGMRKALDKVLMNDLKNPG